jgi:hypothetical protein
MASFAVLKSNLSLYLDVNRQCAAEFSARKQQRLIVHYGLEWLVSVLVLCSHSSQEMLPLQ